jgi:electron transfer flavoprotein alpha subunit
VKGILIFVEMMEGKITSVSRELISVGKKLGIASHQPLHSLLIGEKCESAAEEVAGLGVERVLIASGPGYEEFNPERLASIATSVCQQSEPWLVLFGHTDVGRDVAPRLAAKLRASVCLDCVDLEFDGTNNSLIQTKPVYGGNALAQWISPNDRPHVVTVRSRSEKQAEQNSSINGKIESLSIDIHEGQIKSRLTETVSQKGKGIKLEEAKSIVAGGGGIGGQEGFGLIQDLADILGAAVGTTRVPSDENWMPKNLEIGQTGHMVSPNLYIALAISGAPQHMAGCSNSKTIVAINKDPQAPIFDMADIGIVGDYREIVPALIEKLKALKQ